MNRLETNINRYRNEYEQTWNEYEQIWNEYEQTRNEKGTSQNEYEQTRNDFPWWICGRLGALRPEGSNPILAVTYGPSTSPSLAVACGASAC